MVIRQDLQELTATLGAEMSQLCTEVTTQGTRVQALEDATRNNAERTTAMDQAVRRQGFILIDTRRQVEDLDNCSHRNNIQVRGVPEPEGEEEVNCVLTCLFSTILRNEVPVNFGFIRAHRVSQP
ncbi:Hypothetical predicted protein [Pelobates cultripes]|uniref:Uncharacterized protein n=1 Tax=Pelobates cultripes TaxID=61616 RepID=A0AAD1RST5_PELCU|nr:Hypothetical predicted protein [Pelobates cultripes]